MRGQLLHVRLLSCFICRAEHFDGDAAIVGYRSVVLLQVRSEIVVVRLASATLLVLPDFPAVLARAFRTFATDALALSMHWRHEA